MDLVRFAHSWNNGMLEYWVKTHLPRIAKHCGQDVLVFFIFSTIPFLALPVSLESAMS